MSYVQESHLGIEASPSALGCPVDVPRQKTGEVVEPVGRPVECDEEGVWHIRGFDEARLILRGGSTKQAGFNAEQLGAVPGMQNRPILYQEGKVHQQQRKQTARFFTPKAVSDNYREFMERLADRLVSEVKRKQRIDLSKFSLSLAVPVAGRVVGLTNSRLPGMDKRLDAFFRQSTHATKAPPEHKRGFWRGLRMVINQRRIFAFFFLDVQPAIKARKRQPQEDVISHLLGLKYSPAEILTECVTYAAAGMVTTREFVSAAAWHFLDQPALRARFLVAPENERFEMLHEVLRLEPVVGHLFRRTTAPITLTVEGETVVIPEGALLDLHLYATNADEGIVGEEPLVVKPGRPLQGDKLASMLMSFGDGAHRCPGSFMAIQETDIFLQRLLAIEGLRIEKPPTLTWNAVSAGYELRNFWLVIDPPTSARQA